MKLIFFSECTRFNVNSKKGIKYSQKLFGFLENCIFIGCGKFFILGRHYLSSVVKVLASSPQIADPTKRDVFSLKLVLNDREVR